jgi:hypothetical protein
MPSFYNTIGPMGKKICKAAIVLDRDRGIWFNIGVMRQINRKNSFNWWWPAGK